MRGTALRISEPERLAEAKEALHAFMAGHAPRTGEACRWPLLVLANFQVRPEPLPIAQWNTRHKVEWNTRHAEWHIGWKKDRREREQESRTISFLMLIGYRCHSGNNPTHYQLYAIDLTHSRTLPTRPSHLSAT